MSAVATDVRMRWSGKHVVVLDEVGWRHLHWMWATLRLGRRSPSERPDPAQQINRNHYPAALRMERFKVLLTHAPRRLGATEQGPHSVNDAGEEARNHRRIDAQALICLTDVESLELRLRNRR
jgi:hypothetical protein